MLPDRRRAGRRPGPRRVDAGGELRAGAGKRFRNRVWERSRTLAGIHSNWNSAHRNS